jgi:hypothetical protein
MRTIAPNSKIVVGYNNHDFENDTRFLIPFILGTKFGFCNKNKEIIIEPTFDIVLDDFIDQHSLTRVGKYIPVNYPDSSQAYLLLKYGLINTFGQFVIPLEFEGIAFPDNSTAFSVRRIDKGYAAINQFGKYIVPFGKYSYIDGYCNGYARVKIGRHSNSISETGDCWGIINEYGEEIVKPTAKNIARFYKSKISRAVVETINGSLEFNLADGSLTSGYEIH